MLTTDTRSERGTRWLDDAVRDVLYALRTIHREPLAALTIVATVALGLGLVAVVFTLFSVFFLRDDDVRAPDELFAVIRTPDPRTSAYMPFTRPEYDALRRDTSVFTDAIAMKGGVSTRIDGRRATGTLVSGNFFHVLGVNAAAGRTLSPADDEPSSDAPVIVLSRKGWERLFGSDSGIVGRTVLIEGVPYHVAGIAPAGFRGLRIGPPDFWAPMALANQFRASRGSDDAVAIEIVGRLKPGTSADAAASALGSWAAHLPGVTTSPDRRVYIKLRPSRGTLSADILEIVAVFSGVFFAFGLILLIGCANVANLLLARGLSRQQEIGVRLAVGASRARIVRQLLTESLLLALASAIGGYAVSRAFLESAVHAAIGSMPAEVAEQFTLTVPPADWRVAVFLVAGAIVATAGFGLVPALRATRLELVRAMRGEVTRDARPGRARSVLIGVQVTAATLLLISAAVFLRSALVAATANPGVRTRDTATVAIPNEQARTSMIAAVTSDPSVAAVSATMPPTLAWPGETFATAEGSERAPVAFRFVSREYFGVLDIALLRGRGFTPAERSVDSGVVIVSETAARRFWRDGDPIGQTLHLDTPHSPWRLGSAPPLPATAPSLTSRSFTVAGVVSDVRSLMQMTSVNQAAVYLPTTAQAAGTSLTVRVHGDPEVARQALLKRLTAIDPSIDTVTTLRTTAGLEAYMLSVVSSVTMVLGAFALALTLSGLFSVLSYLVEQRSKEIGVRIALGATTRNVAWLVLQQSLRPVALGLAAGAGLSVTVATVILTTPAASQIGTIVRVADPVPYAATLLLIVVACGIAAAVPALRAARVDPIATLRQN